MASRVHISIIVEKGDPLDYPQYRHTALWLCFSDRSPALQAHVIGTQGMFQFESKQVTDPSTSPVFAKAIDVGLLSTPTTPVLIRQALSRVPINNADFEFNCQIWVQLALQRFKSAGELSEDAYEKGIDQMVDVIAEAEHSEE